MDKLFEDAMRSSYNMGYAAGMLEAANIMYDGADVNLDLRDIINLIRIKSNRYVELAKSTGPKASQPSNKKI